MVRHDCQWRGSFSTSSMPFRMCKVARSVMATVRLVQYEDRASLLVQAGSIAGYPRTVHRSLQNEQFEVKRHHPAPRSVFFEMSVTADQMKRQSMQKTRSTRSLGSCQSPLAVSRPNEVQGKSLHVEALQFGRPKELADCRDESSRLQAAPQNPCKAVPACLGPLLAQQTRGKGARVRN